MKTYLKDFLFILIGNFLLAISVVVFILPNDVLSAGLAGIAILLHPFVPISEQVIITILTYVFFFFGWLTLGLKFAAETLLSTIFYPIFLFVCTKYMPPVIIDPILAALYSGLIGGAGIGLVMRIGGSTGGTDIPPLIVNRYFGVDVSVCVMVTDALTIAFGLWIYGLEKVLIGLLAVYTTGIAIDKIVTFGGSSSLSVQIISPKSKEISSLLQKELHRGATLFKAYGGFKGEEKDVLLIVVSKRQYSRLLQLVKEVDESAFMITTETNEVHGEGFSFESRI